MILERFIKQSVDVKDYDVDYAPWLTPMADTLQNVTHTLSSLSNPADNSLVVDSLEVSPLKVKVWISGGANTKKYKLTLRATTVGGRVDESELLFMVKDI